METIDGVPVTEEMSDAWADEAEHGYDVDKLRGRGRKPKGDGPARVVPVRLDDCLLSALDERAEHDQLSRSDINEPPFAPQRHECASQYGMQGSNLGA